MSIFHSRLTKSDLQDRAKHSLRFYAFACNNILSLPLSPFLLLSHSLSFSCESTVRLKKKARTVVAPLGQSVLLLSSGENFDAHAFASMLVSFHGIIYQADVATYSRMVREGTCTRKEFSKDQCVFFLG